MPIRPSEKEEEYFTKLELERRKREDEEKSRRVAEDEKKRLRELHHMHCPKCGMNLSEIEYRGIKVDKCFSCDGVWLDAGELGAIAKLEQTTLGNFLNLFKK